jgi:hypothetical protein
MCLVISSGRAFHEFFFHPLRPIGIAGVVNLLLRDRATRGRHERQTALRLGATVQPIREMLQQLFLLRQWQCEHSGFDFSECAHDAKDSTARFSAARLPTKPRPAVIRSFRTTGDIP